MYATAVVVNLGLRPMTILTWTPHRIRPASFRQDLPLVAAHKLSLAKPHAPSQLFSAMLKISFDQLQIIPRYFENLTHSRLETKRLIPAPLFSRIKSFIRRPQQHVGMFMWNKLMN